MSLISSSLTPRNVALLALPPLFWAGNAIVGRLVNTLVSPLMFNFLRWLVALTLLLPLAYPVFRRSSALWLHWKRYMLLGLLSVGCYNSLLYLALHTSTPINVTLVGSSMPVFMLAIGALFFQQRVRRRQLIGALLSIAGVLLVLCRGEWQALSELHWVPGDLLMLLATACWSWYSWLLTQSRDPADIRNDWAYFLGAQLAFGLGWSGLFAAGENLSTHAATTWNWTLVAALLYVAVGPSLLAYRFWGLGVRRLGPNVAGFFVNLTPLFTATLSALLLGELPHAYHAAAFALIVSGIVVSSRH